MDNNSNTQEEKQFKEDRFTPSAEVKQVLEDLKQEEASKAPAEELKDQKEALPDLPGKPTEWMSTFPEKDANLTEDKDGVTKRVGENYPG